MLIDGHLRAETTPESIVPVLVLDVDEREADKILVTHDPLAAMAKPAGDELQALLTSVETENEAVRTLLKTLDQEYREAQQFEAQRADRPEVSVPESYQVVVECRDVEDQQAVYERMRGEGYRCRVLTL